MTDMSKYSKKQTPGQLNHRAQVVLDTIRANQSAVSTILGWAASGHINLAKAEFDLLYKQDRDALLWPNGILTDDQIEALTDTIENNLS